MTITIPPEALEAAKKEWLAYAGKKRTLDQCLEAAALALLENWPGMRVRAISGLMDKNIILPLPQETDND